MKYLLSRDSGLLKFFSKYFWGIALIAYLVINLVVYQSFWQELNFDSSTVNAVYGEIMAIEWYSEGVYQNITQGRNPFAITQNLFYPFGTNFVSSETGNAFYFLLTRPFFSTHQSLYLISALSIVAANLGMYLLMRFLNVNKVTSFFMGLFFGYMTFLQPRMGHLTYLSIYVFPWFYYSGLRLINDKENWKKAFFGVLTGFFFAMGLYHNLYYFVMLALSVGIIIAYGILKERKLLTKILKRNYTYLIISLFTSLLILSPWITIFRQTQQFEALPKTTGWSGAVEYSSDLLGYFFPSVYSKHLGKYVDLISLKLEFIRGVFENFSYVGIVIIICALIYFYWMIFKKEASFRKKYSGLLTVVISFWLLTLGPFLHVAGRWCAKPLPGVCMAIPMPFVLFHYLPFMDNIRSPGRLMAGLIFFAYILSGLVINKIFKKSSNFLKYLVVGGLIMIFIIDHQFIYSPALPRELPNKIYETIREDEEFFTVYQTPSIMRDGFVYFGDLSSLDFFIAQLRHGKPVLAGYAGRFPGYKTTYYMNDPFLGYFGRLMDSNLNLNPRIDPNDPTNWQEINLVEAKKSVDFLDIKYVIVDSRKDYAAAIETVLQSLGFLQKTTDSSYTLWALEDKLNNEYLIADFGQPGYSHHVGMGWLNIENEYAQANQRSSALFNVREVRDLSLEFEATSYNQDQIVEIFLNQRPAGEVQLGTQKKKYQLDLPTVKSGINTIHFIFNNRGNQMPLAEFNYIKLKE